MFPKEIATFAASVLSGDGSSDPRHAAISLVVCAQALVKDDPVDSRILADKMRAVAAELDGKNGHQSSMN